MKKIFSFIKTIIYRFKAESPRFWRNMCTFMVSLAAVGIALLTAETALFDTYKIVLPGILHMIGTKMITIGAVGAALSKLTVKDPAGIHSQQDTPGYS